jgi:predicted PurR-regulated permease PerM
LSTDWNKTTKHIVAVGMVLFGLYLLYLSGPVLKILIIAALVAFLLMPVVTFLHNRLKIPRVLATLLSYVGLIVVILLAPLVLLPRHTGYCQPGRNLHPGLYRRSFGRG